mgnify:FL=1
MTTTLTQFEEEKLGEFMETECVCSWIRPEDRKHTKKECVHYTWIHEENYLLSSLHQQREMMRKDLLEIAEQGEYEDLRREVENYFPLPNKEI